MNTTSPEFSLIDTVRGILVSSGLQQQVEMFYDTSIMLNNVRSLPADKQRIVLNRYWTLQLAAASQASIEHRYCLIPNGTVDEWLRLFQQKIVPFLIEERLPVNIN